MTVAANSNLGKSQFPVGEDVFKTDTKYRPIKPLGSGSFGVVCSALDLETEEEAAIKKVVDVFDHPDIAADTLREMTILRQIQHENIIALKSVMWPGHETEFKDVYIVLELMDTTLGEYMSSRKDDHETLSDDEIRKFMFEILCGVNYLHSANILHCDLKPDNILTDSKGHLKICDFGLSVSTARSSSKMNKKLHFGTRWYRAPELLVGNTDYGPPIDMWSAGCIFAEMLGGGVPIFLASNTMDQLQCIISTLGTPKAKDVEFIKNLWYRKHVQSYSLVTNLETRFPKAGFEALDLLKKMLTFDPTKRISAAEALCHPYMAPYYDPEATTGPAILAQCPVELDVNNYMDNDSEIIRKKMLCEMRHYLNPIQV